MFVFDFHHHFRLFIHLPEVSCCARSRAHIVFVLPHAARCSLLLRDRWSPLFHFIFICVVAWIISIRFYSLHSLHIICRFGVITSRRLYRNWQHSTDSTNDAEHECECEWEMHGQSRRRRCRRRFRWGAIDANTRDGYFGYYIISWIYSTAICVGPYRLCEMTVLFWFICLCDVCVCVFLNDVR